MNPRPCLLPLSLALAAFALPAVNRAQTGTPAQPPAATTTGNPTAPQLEPAQLETLLGPVALYPDALIALILPATTAPSDIVLAARFLAANATSLPLETQPWDESVRSLARYPDIIKWLDENLAWTKQLGEVFLAQPAEVMQAIQRLRTRARAAGTLIDTPEQKIVTEGEIILIEPAQPAVIYVPRYDPEIVYVTRSPGWNTPYLYFGVGFATGAWLSYDCDWSGRTIWVGNWRQRPHPTWVRPAFPNRPLHPGATLSVAQPWRAPAHRYNSPRMISGPRPQPIVIYPRPMRGAHEHPSGNTRPHQNEREPQPRPRLRTDYPTPRSTTAPTTKPATLPTVTTPPVTQPPPPRVGPKPDETRRERPAASPATSRPETPRNDTPRNDNPRNNTPRSDTPRPTRTPETPRPTRPADERRDSRPRERDARPTTTPATPAGTVRPAVEPTTETTPR
jgi:hypothetical protein